MLIENRFSVKQVAKMCGVTYRTALNWIHTNKIKSIKIGGKYFILQSVLVKFIGGNNE